MLWKRKFLNTRKNGMAVLLLTLLGYVASIALFIYSITLLDADRMLLGLPLLILSIGYWIAGIFLFCGLKVLKPQEALVLTLFGDYIGTLKGQGFYWVNPFCTAVNPAAGTRLSQSGDVSSKEKRHGCHVWPERPECPGQCRIHEQKDLPENDDPEQLPAEDQRLPGKSGRNRNCRYVACNRYCESCFQRR